MGFSDSDDRSVVSWKCQTEGPVMVGPCRNDPTTVTLLLMVLT